MTWQLVVVFSFIFVTIWLVIAATIFVSHHNTKRHIVDKQVELAKIPRGLFGNAIPPEPRTRVLDDDDS